jgi:hypothetical protein
MDKLWSSYQGVGAWAAVNDARLEAYHLMREHRHRSGDADVKVIVHV